MSLVWLCLVCQPCPALQPHGWQPTRLLCLWGSPGKNTGVGSHCLLQGIFPTHRLNPRLLGLLHEQAVSLPLAPPGKPNIYIYIYIHHYVPRVRRSAYYLRCAQCYLNEWKNKEMNTSLQRDLTIYSAWRAELRLLVCCDKRNVFSDRSFLVLYHPPQSQPLIINLRILPQAVRPQLFLAFRLDQPFPCCTKEYGSRVLLFWWPRSSCEHPSHSCWIFTWPNCPPLPTH